MDLDFQIIEPLVMCMPVINAPEAFAIPSIPIWLHQNELWEYIDPDE